MKSGFVSLIGRPNVGKSTLLNTLIHEKIAITSNKAQTTRNIIQGIYNEPGYQIVFLDTPGIHKPQGKLGKILIKSILFITKITGTLFCLKLSIINLSPFPIPVEASITNKIASTSFVKE